MLFYFVHQIWLKTLCPDEGRYENNAQYLLIGFSSIGNSCIACNTMIASIRWKLIYDHLLRHILCRSASLRLWSKQIAYKHSIVSNAYLLPCKTLYIAFPQWRQCFCLRCRHCTSCGGNQQKYKCINSSIVLCTEEFYFHSSDYCNETSRHRNNYLSLRLEIVENPFTPETHTDF